MRGIPCTQWLPAQGRQCGATPTRNYVCGHRCDTCKPGSLPEVLEITGPARRPPAAGPGEVDIEWARRGDLRREPVDLPACPEHARQVQRPPDRPRVRMCVRCGRVTARLDGDGVAWCGGLMPAAPAPPPL
jgi:hypothetical protein